MKNLLILILIIVAFPVFASTLTVELENDLFYDTDQYYTHGTKITYIDDGLDFILGQNLYTPSDISIDSPLIKDRPYAGILYLGTGYTAHNWDRHQRLEFNLGISGKYSGAEYTQKGIHKLTGSSKPMGWDYQTDTKLLLQVRYRFTGDMFANNYSALQGYCDINAGTIMTHVGFGGTLILGYNIPKILGVPVISKERKFSLFCFADAMEKHVFFNKLLDSDYTDIDPTSAVLDFTTGVGIGYKNHELRYSYKFRSREFIEQIENVKFGSVYIKTTF